MLKHNLRSYMAVDVVVMLKHNLRDSSKGQIYH
jgi:hypothetical protein